MIAYNIMRGNPATLVKAVKPKGSQTVKAMGENLVNMAFTLPVYVDFKLNDFIVLDGEKYIINEDVQWEKTGKRRYSYSVQFQHEFYDLAKVQLKFLDPSNGYRQTKFDIMGNASTIVGLVVESINQNYSGWSVGVVDDTDYKLFSFDATNCLKALYQLVDEFKTEVWFDNKTIHLQKRVQSSGLSLAYGKGNGLLNISRQNKTDANIITRLYVSGSSQNLPTGYRDNVGNLILPGGLNYYQDNAKVALYGLIEASLNFDIKPEREGSVTSVVAGDGNWKYFTDNTLDFDINAQLSAGLEAKVSFLTGQLAGYTFTINNYNHATKSFTINKNEDEKALDLPSNLFRPAVGDKYSLIDIVMPQSYVNDAEARLLAATLEYYNADSEPKFLVGYTASVDKLFVKQNNVNLQLGNTIVFPDAELGLNVELRIAGYTRDLENRDFYEEIEWADTLTVNEVARQSQQQQRTLRAIESSGLLNPDAIRKNIFLNRLSELNGYLMLSGQKVKAGLADFATDAAHAAIADYAWDADKWDGRQFADYLNQPVRQTDAVKFASVVADTVNSTVYVSGFTGSGYRINPDGSAEFDSLTVRKELNINVLNVREITGSGGSVAITNVAKIKEVIDAGTYYQCKINTDDGTIAVQLRANDIVRCQIWDGKKLKYYSAIVTGITTEAFTLSKASFVGGGIPEAGDTVFQFGNTTDINRQGLIYLTNSDTGAPYLDVLDGITSDNLAGKTKVRLGKLNGINDADLGQLDGYGLYAERAFIKGKIVVTGGNAETVTGSQDKANTAQANAISTASGDATAKANNAQNNAITQATSQAAADATTKASAAQVAAIQAAANDATAKANTAQQNAYNGAVSEAQIKADAAQIAAQNYASAQAAYEREIAKSYADGIVDAEETARIADVASKLQAAKDDATAKVNAALTTANGYTDTKALATISAAQTYADNAAQTKANAAQANAISQASTDAQNKANAAQAAAAILSQQLVDGLKIGGRNLLIGSSNGNGWTNHLTGNEFSKTSSANYENDYIYSRYFGLEANTQYTLSFLSKNTPNIQSRDMFILSDNYATNNAIIAIGFESTNDWKLITWTFTTSAQFANVNDLLLRIDHNGTIDGQPATIWVKNIKLEKGNKATDWLPAPEDVQAAIDSAKALADAANASYATLTANLKSLAYQDVVELAKLGTTIIEGGKIKTTLLDADYIRANVINAGYINTLSIDAAAIKSGTIDSARINASQIISNGGGATVNFVNTSINTATTQAQADATAKASAAQVAAIQAAANDASAKIAGIQLGGRNLLPDSSFENGFLQPFGLSGYEALILADGALDGGGLHPYLGTKALYLAGSDANNGGDIYVYLNKAIKFIGGETYTVSFYYAAAGSVLGGSTYINFNSTGHYGIGFSVINDKVWRRVTYTFVSDPANTSGEIRLGFAAGGFGWMAFDAIKVEKGNKVSDWTPAPEDADFIAGQKADAAQLAATNAAYAQAAYEREIAKAYADGKVTAEEQARIAQAASNLQNAKDDAQQKVNAAIATANGYTDAKALATISAAQTYADSIATTKANAAQANAVSQASTDAQNKANAAQAAAADLSQQLIDGLKIGGRNLQIDGSFERGILGNGGGYAIEAFVGVGDMDGNPAFEGTKCLRLHNFSYKTIVDHYLQLNQSVPVIGGQQYTLSFYFKCAGAIVGNSSYYYPNTGGAVYIPVPYDPANQGNWTLCKHTFTPPSGCTSITLRFGFHSDGANSAWVCLDAIKVEEGSKATAYTPAPEDVQAAIDNAKALADAANASYASLTANLKSLAYQDVVELAKLGSTIIEGGKIKTTLLDADYIRANIVNAAYINTLEIVTKNLKTSATGKRVEIDSANNNVRILNDQNAVLIEIDDDSAYEYTRLYFNGPPIGNTYTKFYGPGIRVGNETAARTTMGRYGFTVFDENNAIKHKIGTYSQSNVFLDREDVIFDIQNGFILKNVTASWDANNQYGTKQNIRVFAETISGDFGSAQVLTWTTV